MHRIFAFAAVFALACSSSDNGSGSGGNSGSTGSSGAGGGSGAGGSSGAGGNSGAGGTNAGMSGSSGSSGSSGTGGSSGASGAAGAGGSGDSWDGYAKGFFATYCINCHKAGSATRDYTTIDDVVRDKDEIRCGVGTSVYPGCAAFPPPRQFPIGSGAKPSDAERDRLVAWIEAGAS